MNLAAIVEPHPPDARALDDGGIAITYGGLRAQVEELRRELVALGTAPGDRVVIAVANNSLFVVSYLAVLGVGAVAVPLNPDSPASELEGELAAVGAMLTIAAPAGADAARAIERSGRVVERLLVRGGAATNHGRGADPVPIVDRADGDLAVLMFTAGTAGAPKAAMLTHGNLLASLEQVQSHPGRAVQAGDVSLGVLPLFHIFGLNVMLGLSLYSGASLVLVEQFDPIPALETAGAHGVTLVAGAPPMFAAWAELPGAKGDELASVRLAISGASALPGEVAEGFERRFGLPLWQGYGLTEAAPVVTSPLVGGERRPGSIGVPVPGLEVRLVDEDGEDVLDGDPGEVWVRGPNVFAGYWQEPEATAAVLTPEGWLRTGDVAVADSDGYLWLVDRSKDLVIVSGFNVYPAEVEAVLLEHPDVAEAAVVGTPHPRSGEAVVAYVVPELGRELRQDQVIAWCAARLARYKCPTAVEVVEALPHGVAGKLLRRALRGSL
ncbi:MAG TPA: AMP-binding protein [Acidimicrobiales bacterium]|nr:AMP-binding protein [Acidimicrobiales bacterium]